MLLFLWIIVVLIVLLLPISKVYLVLLLLILVPFAFIVITRWIYHLSIFPGSCWFVRAKVENSVAYHASMVYADRLISYLDVIKAMNKEWNINPIQQTKIKEQTNEILRILEFLLCDLTKLSQAGLLGK